MKMYFFKISHEQLLVVKDSKIFYGRLENRTDNINEIHVAYYISNLIGDIHQVGHCGAIFYAL